MLSARGRTSVWTSAHASGIRQYELTRAKVHDYILLARTASKNLAKVCEAASDVSYTFQRSFIAEGRRTSEPATAPIRWAAVLRLVKRRTSRGNSSSTESTITRTAKNGMPSRRQTLATETDCRSAASALCSSPSDRFSAGR